MPKAKISLSNGTVVEIEGNEAEIKNLLSFYSVQTTESTKPVAKQVRKATSKSAVKTTSSKASGSTEKDISEIVNLVKTCEEAESIET